MINLIKYLLTIAALLIFFQPAVGATGIYLTNQNGVQTTQFSQDDSIYLEGSCALAPSSADGIRIYVAFDKTWTEGNKLSDVSSSIESLKVTSDVIPRTLIWRNPLNNGAYDAIIDINNDLVLQPYENCIIGKNDTGFRVGSAPPTPASSTPTPSTTPSPQITPPALPTPPPTPPTQPEPPQIFSLQDYIEIKNLANVRKSPGGPELGRQYAKSQGTIIGGPVKAKLGGQNFWFWNVDFEEKSDGWVADQTLIKSRTKPTEELKTEEAEEKKVSQGNIDETIATTTPKKPEVSTPTAETQGKNLAQISEAGGNSGTNQFINALTIGIAILLGLVIGSSIIARAMRRS